MTTPHHKYDKPHVMVNGHAPRKRFGQNFLHDAYIIERIVSEIAPRTTDYLVEIGPGMGALTEPVLKTLAFYGQSQAMHNPMHVIEIDRDLAARLRQKHPEQTLVVHEQDALKTDFTALVAAMPCEEKSSKRIRVIGNLPYNISSPLLFHLLAHRHSIIDQHFMLQREVIDRMIAKVGDDDYGRLSVMLSAYYRMEKCFDVPPEAFTPAPKVWSAIVRMQPIATTVNSFEVFSKIVALAFSQRRKMLRATLGKAYDSRVFEVAKIDLTLRAEQLSVAQFIALANQVHETQQQQRQQHAMAATAS
jgi:16S rRNA (adenine1518-N6/adenine1519-N6)-dimethyltransferase